VPAVILVVPCYNEARRLRPEAFRTLAAAPEVGLQLVDDGSTDGTPPLLAGLAATLEGRAEVLRLPRNAGKAEAVRRGLQRALARGAGVVGYVDADLSTPVEEVLRLVEAIETDPVQVVMGARVARLGAHIERSAVRHYLGRIFATVASLVIGLPVYDTQCGAKVFRASPSLHAALARPFRSPWAFDVELIHRLLVGGPAAPALAPDDFLEIPLRRWTDVRGSKIRPGAMVRAGLSLLALGVRHRRPRGGGPGPRP
jgi:glycosyltransferase involved in cell wall biosynthesis